MSQSHCMENSTEIDLTPLTMIFISRNRQEILLKHALFFRKFGARIIILDGSDKELPEDLIDSCAHLIDYIYSPKSLEYRLKLARGMSVTPFTVVSTDDDLFVPSALHKSITFLQENPEVLACSGRTIGFIQKPSGVDLFDCYPENDKLGFQFTPRNKPVRLLQYFFTYSSRYFYSVYRTTDWDDIFTSFCGKRILPRNYLELIVEFRACWGGTHHILPDLFWLRNFTNPPIRAGEKYRNFVRPLEYLKIASEILGGFHDHSRKSLSLAYLERSFCILFILSIDILNFLRAIHLKFSNYIAKSYRRNEKKERPYKLSELMRAKGAKASDEEIKELLSQVL